MEIPRFVMLEKAVGQTPLECMEAWRAAQPPAFADLPLTYAGRLDPMASGKLLILISEECKKKDEYLALDKTYEFSVLFGIGSDTHDVLGRLFTNDTNQSDQILPDLKQQLESICKNLTGDVELPYPHFSSKTVQGKPLHTWTLEGRLNEIEIPTRQSTIYSLELERIETKSKAEVCDEALTKIDTVTPVTNQKKSLGNDFRRTEVRADWGHIKNNNSLTTVYHIAHFTCTASSGTYMRTLAKLIGEQLKPAKPSLAWSIHRKRIDIK